MVNVVQAIRSHKLLAVALMSVLMMSVVSSASASHPALPEPGYTVLYELNIPVGVDYNDQLPPYSIDNTATVGSFDRVAYLLELDGDWAYVSMDAFSTVPEQLGVPVAATGATFQETVSDMNVFSNFPGITTGTGITTGNIEFWNQCYFTTTTLGLPGASSGSYDFDDFPVGPAQGYPVSSCYGSMQVHNYGAAQTVIACNRWGGGGTSDLGIGNSPGSHPDWTFRSNAGGYSSRTLTVLVRDGGGTPAPTPPATALSSCSAILAGGQSTGDGMYWIDPSQGGVPADFLNVYCDMTTDGGGWTLAGYGANSNLSGRLNVANGAYAPVTRTGSANFNAVDLARLSSEVALSWHNSSLPTGNLQSYQEAVGYGIPNPAAQTLNPNTGGFNCNDPKWTLVDVNPLVGSPTLPAQMYTRTDSLGASYGRAYGLVGPSAFNPFCDWHIDSQQFKAVYLGIAPLAFGLHRGVVYGDDPTVRGPHVIPQTMAIWLRGATATEALDRTPWQQIITPEGVFDITLSNPSPIHGDKRYYSVAPAVPAENDSRWTLALDPNTVNFHQLSRVNPSLCLRQADFGFFQTIVTIPVGTTISTFTISFSDTDDGARVTIFNSDNPSGVVVPNSYVFLGGNQTADLSGFAATGSNRLVVTQVDDCYSGNNLGFASVVLNGASVPTIDTVSISDASVTEGGNLEFDVSLSNGLSVDTVVTYSTADGSATTADSDYTSRTNQTLTIPAGQTSGTITVATTPDNKIEPDETLDVNLANVLATANVESTGPIFWTDWTGAPLGSSSSPFVGNGTITTDTSTVSVTYSNPQGIAFYQPSGGTDYYQNNRRGRNPATSPYTSDAVTNIPTGSGIVALRFAGSQTLTFSEVIANPVFSYVSLNGNGYAFDQDFEVLSFGGGPGNDCGFWGCGTSFKSTVDLGNGNFEYQLLGTGEPHGTIRFVGTFDTLTWRSLSDEYWNGFTVGVQGTAAEVGLDVTILDGTGQGTIVNDDSDDTPPVVTVPADITVEATSAAGAVVNFTATTEDDVDGAITPSCDSASGATFPLGYTSVTCTATDAAGNSGSASFAVNVVDTTPPDLTVPANITVEGDTTGGANVTLPNATATDIVDSSPAVSCDQATGFFPLGETTVICTATDDEGNSSGASYTVTVVDTHRRT